MQISTLVSKINDVLVNLSNFLYTLTVVIFYLEH